MPIQADYIFKVTSSPSKRYIIKQAYELFYRSANKRIVTVSKKLPYHVEDELYYAVHVKIQSEHEPDIWYDIVVQILDKKLVPSAGIRVYNNCPAFVYFIAYVYYKHDAIIFPHLYPIQVFTVPPRKRNPHQLPDPDKYTYAAIRFVQSNRITYDNVEKFRKEKWTYIASPSEVEHKRTILTRIKTRKK